MWLAMLRECCKRQNAIIYAYCQMTNHFHLLIETKEANLHRFMQTLNARYSQAHNRRHESVGHLFQGRYKAILVQRDPYLLELARYIVLNPVRACMVEGPGDWTWSSYHWMFRTSGHPPWLAINMVLEMFGGTGQQACERYATFVAAGIGRDSPLKETRHRVILGDPAFVAEHCTGLIPSSRDIVRTQRRHCLPTLAEFGQDFAWPVEAMARAYWTTAYTMREISQHFGVSEKTVSRAIKRYQIDLAAPASPQPLSNARS